MFCMKGPLVFHEFFFAPVFVAQKAKKEKHQLLMLDSHAVKHNNCFFFDTSDNADPK